MFENNNVLDGINSKLDCRRTEECTWTHSNGNCSKWKDGGVGSVNEPWNKFKQPDYVHVLGVLKEEVGTQNIWNTGWICSKWEENCHVTNSRSLMNPKHKKHEENYAKSYHNQIV